MTEPLTLQLVADLIRQLHVAFPRNIGAQNAQFMADTYRNGLRGLSGDAVRWAVDQSIREDKFFPRVARLRELAGAWQRSNYAEAEALIQRPAGWCVGCQSVARNEMRWRPKVDDHHRRITDGAGRILLEQFERVVCRCDAPSRYSPDGPDDDYMTENRRRSDASALPVGDR